MFNGYENIKRKLIFYKVKKEERRRLLELIANYSELGEALFRPVETYSAGMLFRLSFSILINLKFDILLMDEMIGLGDESFRNKARKDLNIFLDSAKIVIVTSHDKNLLQNFCDKIYTINNGIFL